MMMTMPEKLGSPLILWGGDADRREVGAYPLGFGPVADGRISNEDWCGRRLNPLPSS